MKYISNGIILILCFFKLNNGLKILKLKIPNHAVSYCSYRMNFTHYFGCNSESFGNIGSVLVGKSLKDMKFKLSKIHNEKLIVVIPARVFTKKSTVKILLEKQNIINGVVVLEPDYCLNSSRSICNYKVQGLHHFSESDPCREPFYTYFNKRFCYFSNMFGFHNIYETKWPFPLVLLKNRDGYHRNIVDCYEKYNSVENSLNKCKIHITNYSPKPSHVASCIERQHHWINYLRLSKNFRYCSELTGNNIYQTFNPSRFYYPKSIILILTRLDSISLFDTASAGTHELYPSISMLMFMAQIFNLTKFPNSTDILLGFLDNESFDNLGSIRMIFDLKNNQISNGIGNISDKNIKLIISIDDFTLSKNKNLYAFLYKCERDEEICSTLLKQLKIFSQPHGYKLIIHKMFISDIWVKTINVPKISFQSSLMGSDIYRKSFLDRMEPENETLSVSIGTILSLSIVKTMNGFFDNFLLSNITIKPDDIASCFFDFRCSTLRRLIGQRERNFYILYGNPLTAQSYIDGFIAVKQGKYINRLSYIVLKLLVYHFRTSIETDPNCADMGNLNNFSITVNDVVKCVHANIQVMTSFNPKKYSDSRFSFFHVLSDLPIYMRSSVVKEQKLLLFVSVNNDLYVTEMILATLFTVLCFAASIFIRRNIDNYLPADIY